MNGGNFGPWSAGIDATERVACLRALRAITLIVASTQTEFTNALRRAESDEAWLATAYGELDRMPALVRRHVLSHYAAVVRPFGK